MYPGLPRCFRIARAKVKTWLRIPFFLSTVHCGFPSAATDFLENVLDLNELCILHQDSTYFVGVEGDSMINPGGEINARIDHGDTLVVDCFVEPVDGQIIIAYVNDGYVVRRMKWMGEVLVLHADNSQYEPIYKHPDHDDSFVFGTVTWIFFKPTVLP